MDALSNLLPLEEQLCNMATMKKVPLGTTFELLPLCNMNCDMCYIRLSREEQERRGRIRSGEEWLDLAKTMAKNGTLFVLLTGGEPLLHRDFKEIYTGLLKMGMIVTVNTNGTLIDEEWADFFAQHMPRRINVTLYDKDGDGYEGLCHYREGFERTIRGLKLLKERQVPVKINGSLTTQNRDSAMDLLRIAEDLGLAIQIDTYMYPSCRERSQFFDQNSRLGASEAGMEYVRIKKHQYPGADYDTYREETLALVRPVDESNVDCSVQCRAGKGSCVVNWMGQLQPCTMLSMIAEDIDSQGFASAWQHIVERVSNIRISLKCARCESKGICQTCAACAMLETGAYDGTPEYLCEYTSTILQNL